MNSQNNINEAWEHISSKLNHHRAKKDISEALEKLPSSIFLGEAHRAILTNHNKLMALSNRCV